MGLLPPFAKCNDDFTVYTWFMGASRARQLLAVVEVALEFADADSRTMLAP